MSECTITAPNPSGLCMCGCGQPAPIARANDKRYGIIKGLPQRYIKGHQVFKSPANQPYIVDANGCWIWQRAVNSSGYGHLYVGGVHKYAHVHYYEQANGLVENNGRTLGSSQVHHLCSTRLCVNPDHLEAIDINAHREGHGIMKFSDAVIADVRKLRAEGVHVRDIAAKHGISIPHIYAVTNGRSSR